MMKLCKRIFLLAIFWNCGVVAMQRSRDLLSVISPTQLQSVENYLEVRLLNIQIELNRLDDLGLANLFNGIDNLDKVYYLDLLGTGIAKMTTDRLLTLFARLERISHKWKDGMGTPVLRVDLRDNDFRNLDYVVFTSLVNNLRSMHAREILVNRGNFDVLQRGLLEKTGLRALVWDVPQ